MRRGYPSGDRVVSALRPPPTGPASGAQVRWVWVSLPYATFGLRVADGRVVEAPPIARWAVGKTEQGVADYYRSKGAQFRRIEWVNGPTTGGRGDAPTTRSEQR